MTTRIPLAYQYDIALSAEHAARLARSSRKGAYKFSLSEQEIIVATSSLPAEFVHRCTNYTSADMRDRAKVDVLVSEMHAAGLTSATPYSQVVMR